MGDQLMMRQLSLIVLISGLAWPFVPATDEKTFGSPEEARDALIQAAAKGLDAVREVLGARSGELVRTGDAVNDANALARFNQLAAEKAELDPEELDPNRMTLSIGKVEWPFGIPLVKKDGRWYWDVDEGRVEIRRRIIGGNELDAIEICRGYVE